MLGRKTVASITAGLGKMVKQLETHRADELKRKDMLDSEIIVLVADAEECAREAERAEKVAAKIKALIEA